MKVASPSPWTVRARRALQGIGAASGAAVGLVDGALRGAADSVHLSAPWLGPATSVAGLLLGARQGAWGAAVGAVAAPLATAALLSAAGGSWRPMAQGAALGAHDRAFYWMDRCAGLAPGVPVLNSHNDPLHVDYLEPAVTGLPGRIGLTLAPGQRSNRAEVCYDRDLGQDLDRLRQEGAHALVSLIDQPEFGEWGVPKLRAEAQQRGIESVWFPIPDGFVPSSMEKFQQLVRDVRDRCRRGETVVIHCKAGRGRTGLLAACCLVAQGRASGEAMALVRKARPHTISNRWQERFVERFAAEWKG